MSLPDAACCRSVILSEGLAEKHVHLKDKVSWARGEYDFPIFGDGILNLPRILASIDAAQYHGPISVEVELDGHPSSPEHVDRALQPSLAYLMPLLAPPSSETPRVLS
jgi:sugar phosphate isomerase/epimerase